MTMNKDAELQAIGQSAAEDIAELVAALECDYDRLADLRDADDLSGDDAVELAELADAAGECESEDDARRRIEERPLSVLVRTDWHPVSDPPDSPYEFEILLGTGAPAARIIGTLNAHCEPDSARIEARDWGTPWTEYRGDAVSEEDLLTFCRCFCFGES